MKKATPVLRTWLASVALGFCLAATANAAAVRLVYDNTSDDLTHRFETGGIEFGDEINLDLSQGHKYVTLFSFEYWGTSATSGSFAGDVEVKARLYANDGPSWNGDGRAPGTVLFESVWWGINPTERSTMNYQVVNDFPGPGILLPSSTITLGIEFRGMGTGDHVGIDCYGPPSRGTGYYDYWQRIGSDPWELKENGGLDISVGAKVVAVVPEPSSLALGALGALALFASRRR